MSLKKILIILIILLILVVGLLVVYNFFLKEEPTPPDTPPATTPPTTSPTGPIQALTQEPVLSPTIDGQKVKYYSKNNGYVFESNFDGSSQTRLSSNILLNLLKVIWSPNKDKVIAVFEENGLPRKYLYDYNTGISTALDRNIRWLAWSPIEDKIAYQYYNSQTEDNNISIANPDGSQWTNVFTTRMKNLIVEWPSLGQVVIRTKPSGLAQSVVYTVNLATGDFQKIISETYGLTVLWSPLGDKLLFSETNNQGKNLKLKIADLAKSTIGELNFVTLPEKCVWSQDNRTLFCAVPKNISDSATLPDDYYKKRISFTDEFWAINLDAQEAIRIFIPENEGTATYDAKELLLSPQEDYLLFINQPDGLLYSLEL
ncbi:MAG: hypothetical protein ISS88_00405 [Candidatus Portnoybacteria bacterium]|nr:hypothetical protein [Candidatus Portnoybacteria bacterium]